MAPTFPLSIPDVTDIVAMQWRKRNAVARSDSPFTLTAQVQEHAGERWEVTVQLKQMERADANKWAAFLAVLRGSSNTFLLGDAHNTAPLGAAKNTPGTPLVMGASQTGSSLVFDGAPNTATNYLKAGDWIQLGSSSTARLYMVTEDVSSNGSGEVTACISPDLRSSPANNAVVTLTNTLSRFRLSENTQRWDINQVHLYGFQFEAVEAL